MRHDLPPRHPTPTTDVVAPAGGMASRGQQPLTRAQQSATLAGVALQAVVPAGNCRPYGLTAVSRACGRLLPLWVAACGH
ncbi:hypothetical protein B296_00045795 [Ensete ventricosum]|uniref:Uncharacterized protein n=1 Tax=Ensete ventricosum TaxID=4639 RepID=A0A426WZ42_ENSVE|nr:hypothetical protein B296_00045795 [Ensete ventricosum]